MLNVNEESGDPRDDPDLSPVSPERRKRYESTSSRLGGIAAAFCSAMGFAVGSICLKSCFMYYPSFTTLDVTISRFITLPICCSIVGAFIKQNPLNVQDFIVKKMVMGVALGVISTFLMFFSVSMIPLGKASVIYNTSKLLSSLILPLRSNIRLDLLLRVSQGVANAR